MYRKKRVRTNAGALWLLIVPISLMGFILVDLDSFWVAPDYMKDGTAENELEACAMYAGDWIQEDQKYDGSFHYLYYPLNDSYTSDYNILRHAGTTYAILMLFERTGELRYLRVALDGINFLLKYIDYVDKDTSYILHDDKGKLGGTALSLLCLTKYKDLTKNPVFDDYIDKMGEFLLYMQEDEGWFRSFYYYEGDYDYNENSSIYPGEAMLALIRLYKTMGEDKYLEALEKAYTFYSNDQKYEWRNSAFIPWTTSAFAEAYEETEKIEYANFAFAMSDFQLNWQIKTDQFDEEDNNLKGGFSSEPSINTASYLEGIGDTYKLAKLIDNALKIEVYESALIIGAEFILSLQYRHEEVEEFTHPGRAFGGFHLTLSGDDERWSEIRIDYTQHSLSAILKILNYFSDDSLDRITLR